MRAAAGGLVQHRLELRDLHRKACHRNWLDSRIAQRIANETVPQVAVVGRHVGNGGKFRLEGSTRAMYSAV
jgi:hypothetical protein